MRKASVLVVVTSLLLVLSGCSGGDEEPPEATRTASNGDVFNDADVDFATEMIQHHSQALVMVDVTRGKQVSPEVARLAEDILATQGAEIEEMTGWLKEWDQPVPETARDHANAHDHGDGEGDDELTQLESAQGEEFERLWLESMIVHHQDAVEMAEQEQTAGAFPPAIELAESIAASQEQEIEAMEGLLGS